MNAQLPTLTGSTTGVVGQRPGPRGRTEWDLQCEVCGAIETTDLLVTMKTMFYHHAQGDFRRMCPACHEATGACDRRCDHLRSKPTTKEHP